MNTRKAARMVKFLGKTGAKIFYFILGTILIAIGIGAFFRIINIS